MKLILALITFLCMTINGTADAGEYYRFAFIGFNSRVQNSNLGDDLVKNFPALQEMMTVELGDCRKIDLVDTTGIVQQFNANEMVLPLDEKKIPAYAKAFAQLDVDYYIYGYITNMSLKESVQGFSYAVAAGGESKTVEVDISVRVVDAKTMKQVYVATGKGQETTTQTRVATEKHSLKFGGEYLLEENVFKAIEKAVQQVGVKFSKNI